MRAGILRHVITIEVATPTRNSSGGFYNVWATVTGLDAVRAEIQPQRGREGVEASKIEADVTHKVRIYYRPNITPKNRIKYNDPNGARYFDIKQILRPGEFRNMMDLMVEEVDV